jgi:hypothetical protein
MVWLFENGTPRSPGRVVGTPVECNLKCCLKSRPADTGRINRRSGLPSSRNFSVRDTDGDESRRIQGNAALFDTIGEKAIANQAERAHGQPMHNNSAGAGLFAEAGQA